MVNPLAIRLLDSKPQYESLEGSKLEQDLLFKYHFHIHAQRTKYFEYCNKQRISLKFQELNRQQQSKFPKIA